MAMVGLSKRRRLVAGTAHYTALGAYLVFAIFPIFWLVKISVTPNRLLYTEGVALWPSRITLANYDSVILASRFPRFFLNSVIVSVSSAIMVTILAAAAGYALSRFRFAAKGPIIFIMLLTQTFPVVLLIVPIFRILGDFGLTNNLGGLVIVYSAFNLPFAVFLMRSFFEGIPRELEDAAMIDGCTRLMALRKVVLPITLPGLGATLGFVFTAAWSELLFALMLIRSERVMTFPVGLLSFVGRFGIDFGQMMAASVLALIPAAVFFFMIQRYLVSGLTAGAVKA